MAQKQERPKLASLALSKTNTGGVAMKAIQAVPCQSVLAAACGECVDFSSVKFKAYKADEMVELVKRVLPYMKHDNDCEALLLGPTYEEEYECTCGLSLPVAELLQMAGK